MERVNEFDLFERELARHPWDQLRQCSEEWRQDVPLLLTNLVTASSEAEASAAYFRLEGACFPQRLVTQSCVAVVSSLLAGLAGRPNEAVVKWLLEALRCIIAGEPILSEIDLGAVSFMTDCQEAALPGLWLLYGLSSHCSGGSLDSLRLVVAELDATWESRFG